MQFTHNMCEFPAFDDAVRFMVSVHLARAVKAAQGVDDSVEVEVIPPQFMPQIPLLLLSLSQRGGQTTLGYQRFHGDVEKRFSWYRRIDESGELRALLELTERPHRLWLITWVSALTDQPLDGYGWDWDDACPRDFPGTQNLRDAVNEKLAYSQAHAAVVKARGRADEVERESYGNSSD